MELRGQTALVTGGAVRIGEAIVRRLAAAGCAVVVQYNRSHDAACALRDELSAEGKNIHIVRSELGNEAGCRSLVERACAAAGPLSILVNNAAVFHKDGLFDTTEDKCVVEMATNLVTPVLLTRFLVEQARAEGVSRGGIVNILDRRIDGHDPSCVPYLLSKKALAAFTETAAVELAPEFTVNGIAPGAILPPPGQGEETIREMAGRRLLTSRGVPSDVAEAVVFLLKADAITGQIVYVDGGQHLVV